MNSNPWDLDKFKDFIGCEESNVLDFKSSRDLSSSVKNKQENFIDDLTKHISAFLNCDGGNILIGLEEADRNNQPDIATGLSDGVPRTQMSAAKLTQRLCDRIHPSVSSYVKVFPIIVGKDSEGDLLAFVVEMKAGITAYQAKDKLYYARRSYSSEPMEDKDIRLRMLASDKPRAALKCEIKFYDTHPILDTKTFNAHLTVENVGYQTIREYLLRYRIVADEYTEKFFDDKNCYVIDSKGCTMSPRKWEELYFKCGVDEQPLFPGSKNSICIHHFSIPKEANLKFFSLSLESQLYVDNGQNQIEEFDIGNDMLLQLKTLNDGKVDWQ